MLEPFTGRRPGDHAYLECLLGTDLTDYGDEEIPPHKQVDVRLPNNKILRLPYAWLRGEPEDVSQVLAEMLDASEEDAPKRVTVRRAPPAK